MTLFSGAPQERKKIVALLQQAMSNHVQYFSLYWHRNRFNYQAVNGPMKYSYLSGVTPAEVEDVCKELGAQNGDRFIVTHRPGSNEWQVFIQYPPHQSHEADVLYAVP